MNKLILPHGGSLVDRELAQHEVERIKLGGLLRLNVQDDILLDLEKIAIGAYSPLRGFMSRDDVAEVVYRMRLADGTPWPIPIVLSVSAATARLISRRDRVVLCDMESTPIAIITVRDVFSFPRAAWARHVYATDDRAHPGVGRLYAMQEKLIGGEVVMLRRPRFSFEKFNLDPRKTRKLIQERGWRTVAGFQTRNVPHRAHEYLQKVALSLTDGILIHPIIGWKKDGDFRPEVVIASYKALIRGYFPRKRVIFAGLATAMRYAGPREAVFHAIIRKNYGCTHFIVGRDHAGVGDYYGKYDAHSIFDRVGSLGITPLLFKGPYYCRRCREVTSEKICPHKEIDQIQISGTTIRALLADNKPIPEYLLRPEVLVVVKQFSNKQKEFIL